MWLRDSRNRVAEFSFPGQRKEQGQKSRENDNWYWKRQEGWDYFKLITFHKQSDMQRRSTKQEPFKQLNFPYCLAGEDPTY